jgi:putative phosphoribosyl transferase
MNYDFNEFEKDVTITGENRLKLYGILAIPPDAKSIVVFAHGSGSSRLSSRNNFVARVLQQHHHATLLVDLLSEDEAKSRELVFNIPLLAGRLNFAKSWLQTNKDCGALPIAFFGASTGAAAALMAAAQDPEGIFAVVSRGGRPDLAGNFLGRVRVPTLLIVGADDEVVLDLNARAAAKLHCPNELKVIPGATHLFEEPQALEKVAKLAADWLNCELSEVSSKNKLIGGSYEVSTAGIL